MKYQPLFYDGLYMETITIYGKKFYSVIKDRKLLIYTPSEKNAKAFLESSKANQNDPQNS